jgi:hypothetical protein
MTTVWNQEDAIIAAGRSLKGLGELGLDGDRARLVLDGGTVVCFDLVRCEKLTPVTALRVLDEARRKPNPLVACPYVDQKLAAEFRAAGVPFVDSAGNVFLKRENVLVWQVGARPLLRHTRELATLETRAFQPTGLKFLYEIMARDCTLIAGTYRELNALTGVSLGAIGWILRSLGELGFLTQIDGTRRFSRKPDLRDQWCDAYRRKLRPKNLVGRFSLSNQRDLLELKLPPCVFWGGEVAAAKLTGVVRPEFGTLYAEANINLCIAKLGLREDKAGKVELLAGFWREPLVNTELVPPLLVYADMITSGSSRNAEAARAVRERFLTEAFA